MSSDIAIRVENLSKCYQIYDKPRDRLLQGIMPRLQRMVGQQPKQYCREFWALKDVSFEVKKGETVGIIGRNGSGKSTLLQMICGTLTPTSGSIQTNGRVAALLELGSGFNPEFNGRENVYMNASILGLTSEEIDARFDDIVNFADIGDFIDQPVKTYSSGMFVRLAFAVISHVDAEILVIDEALAVGDIAFQNKCAQKIQFLKQQGASILFVSHDLSTVQIMCDHAIWIGNGRLMLEGSPVSVCQEYYTATMGDGKTMEPGSSRQIPQESTGMARFTQLRLLNNYGRESRHFSVGDEINIAFELMAEANLDETVFAVSIYRSDGDWLVGQSSRERNVFWPGTQTGGILEGTLLLTPGCFTHGDYLVAFGAYSKDLSICYGLTDLSISFDVRSSFQTWGKFNHPCEWSNGTNKG